MANTNVTIYEVAAKSGVSLATVSRVLNNPDKVKEETKKRVLKAIEELKYYPNSIARGLASKKTTTVGVIISDITRASVSLMLAGILDIARSYKYSIKIFQIETDDSLEQNIQLILSEQVDGVLYLNDQLNDKSIEHIRNIFEKNQVPFVLSNVTTNNGKIPMISIDYKKAGYELTKLLIDNGAKNIYFISNVKDYSVDEKKEAGYLKAIMEAELEPKIFRTSSINSVNRKHFKEFFKDKKIDAAIAVRDSFAISFMNTMIDFGYNVPNDIQVCGFDNTNYAILSRPTLTALDTPVYDIGAVAMRLLTKLMDKENVDNIQISLPHTIIERNSTKK